MRIRRGLYAVTDTRLCQGPGLLWSVQRAIIGGAVMIQYRDKSADHPRRLAEATALQRLCHDHEVALIINDDPQLARECGAAGVHLGIEDASWQETRRTLGAEALIGVSCYNRLELALQARDAGADYVAFGRFFPSTTKPDAVKADIALLREARRRLDLPIAVIGGIDAGNGASLVAAGADLLAVVGAVFAAPDPMLPARAIQDLYATSSTDMPR